MQQGKVKVTSPQGHPFYIIDDVQPYELLEAGIHMNFYGELKALCKAKLGKAPVRHMKVVLDVAIVNNKVVLL